MAYAAVSAYWSACLLLAVFGYQYITAKQFMSYYTEATQEEWEDLHPEIQHLVLALMFQLGGACIAMVLATIGLSFFLLAPYSPIICFVVAFPGLVLGSVVTLASHRLKKQIKAKTPIFPAMIGLGLFVFGFLLSLLGLLF